MKISRLITAAALAMTASIAQASTFVTTITGEGGWTVYNNLTASSETMVWEDYTLTINYDLSRTDNQTIPSQPYSGSDVAQNITASSSMHANLQLGSQSFTLPGEIALGTWVSFDDSTYFATFLDAKSYSVGNLLYSYAYDIMFLIENNTHPDRIWIPLNLSTEFSQNLTNPSVSEANASGFGNYAYKVFNTDTGLYEIDKSGQFTFALSEISTAAVGAIPEPASWALMIGGFGLTGTMLRASRRKVPALA